MEDVVLLSLITLVLVWISGFAAGESSSRASLSFGVMGVFLFALLVGALAPAMLWDRQVPADVEELTKRLDMGVAYQLHSSVRDNDSLILVVQKEGSRDFRVIRTAGPTPPPEYFTLMQDGKPVAIPPFASAQ
ncbi:MAG: hypothetical protein G01um101449_43 [Parcubacteria group bacterium Gr01-1014_49]|nr:MAG: hypothetical protein G01um101449_43 [Parcubacteria group bacterium Gr01-1014_49]